MKQYLESSEYIDWATPEVEAKAIQLAEGKSSEEEIAKACFEFVRDEIKHSWDHQLNPVASKASEVLEHKTGYCYSKSHLLAALLRANGIPAALCYQRLTFENDSPPFCLHGLNAVHLKKHGWIRIDARVRRIGRLLVARRRLIYRSQRRTSQSRQQPTRRVSRALATFHTLCDVRARSRAAPHLA
jgi:transglutaminase-like putative cysteine protease